MNNTNRPLVSVCIPAYNNAEYIAETIQCILDQTLTDLELVICDDHSKDNTVEVIKSFDDPRIRLIINEKNLGMSGNWNNCLKHCRGKYIKLICADDMLAPTALEKEVGVMEINPTAVMSESDTQFRNLEGVTKGSYKRYPASGLVDGKKIAKAGILYKNFFGAPLNNTFRASVLEKVSGFDTDFTYILDYNFFVDVACLGDVYIIHEPLNYFRLRNDSNTGKVLTTEQEAYVNEHKMLLDKHRAALQINELQYRWSILMRRILNFGSAIYLKLFK